MLKAKVLKANKNTNKQNNKLKQCANCNQEFEEKDNFNWSCKTHQSEYSGLLWWCCGKKSIYDEGCKTGKHESDDLDDEDTHTDEIDLSLIKCMCCKERGHMTENCPQEPNIRTNNSAVAEEMRVKKIHTLRKLFAHTNVATTQFLKTCVKVQKIPEIDEDDSDYEFIQERVVKEKDRQYNNFFQRGIMTFEDYNYQSHNPYILVNKDNVYPGGSPNPVPISAGLQLKVQKAVQFGEETSDDPKQNNLTIKKMNESQRSMDTYKYDEMNMETESQALERENEEEQEKERQAKLAMDKADEEGDKDNSGAEPQSAYPDEDESVNSDVEETAFYIQQDIDVTKERQQADLFKDVNFERSEIMEMGNPKHKNFLDIDQFAPIEQDTDTKEEKQIKAKARKEKQRMDLEEKMMNDAVAIQEANKQIQIKKDQLKMQGNIKDKIQAALNKKMQDKLQKEIENLINFKVKYRDTVVKGEADKAELENMKKEDREESDSGSEDEYHQKRHKQLKNKRSKSKNNDDY